MRSEPFTPQDLPRLIGLEVPGWQGLDEPFGYYLERAYCQPLKIERDGRLVAAGGAIFPGNVGWLGHIVVAPDCRGQGLGRTLTQDLIDLLEAGGAHTQLLIASDLGLPVYRRLGFVPSVGYRFFGASDGVPSPPDPSIRPMTGGDRAQAIELDRRASGYDRGAVWTSCERPGWVYAPAGGPVRGFYQPDLGEGAVIASDTAAGLALLRHKHRAAHRRTGAPLDNEHAMEFFAARGTRGETAVRMVRNGVDAAEPAMIYGRAAGFLG